LLRCLFAAGVAQRFSLFYSGALRMIQKCFSPICLRNLSRENFFR